MMSSEPSALSADADKEVGNDQHPWICPGCGQFIVRRGPSENPSHPCAAAGTSVEFVPYLDNEQALSIRRSIEALAGHVRPASDHRSAGGASGTGNEVKGSTCSST